MPNSTGNRPRLATGATNQRKALITGITGQDGAYLSQFLLGKGYEVYGLVRRSSAADVIDAKLRWLGIEKDVRFIDGNLTDLSSLVRIMRSVRPDEIYNLAAQSFVKSSWNQPLLTGTVTALGAANVLEAMRLEMPTARFYQASSSEMYGMAQQPSQSETTPFLSQVALRNRESLCPLDDNQLSGKFRPSYDLRNSLQSRISVARSGICDAESDPRGRSHKARPR